MKFDSIEVGDEVSVYLTDCHRRFTDMLRYIGREKVIAVTPGTLTTPRGKFFRRTGDSIVRSKFRVEPANEEREARSLAIQAKYDADAAAAKAAKP